MFETSTHAEIQIHEAFQAYGERAWAYVYRRLHLPWFHLRYLPPPEAGDGDVRLWQLVFLDDVEHLAQLQKAEGIEIDEVQVVLPGHLTGKGNWVMEPIEEIWVGNESAVSQHTVTVYVLRNGERYNDSGSMQRAKGVGVIKK
ncbi:MAG: hypothetical protein ACJ8NR_18970 [Sulfurifustis sp.]